MRNKRSNLKIFSIGLLGIFIICMVVRHAGQWLNFGWFGMLSMLISKLMTILLAYFLVKLFIVVILKRRPEDYLITRFYVKKEWIILSVLLAIATIFLLRTPLLSAFNQTEISGITRKILYGSTFSRRLSNAVIAGMLFRGVLLNVLREKYSLRLGVIVSSILFGFFQVISLLRTVESTNWGLSLFDSLFVFFGGIAVGIMFSLLDYYSRSIWASVTVYTLWKIILILGIFIPQFAHQWFN